MTSAKILQLVSPALPVGAFSYSEGLEYLSQVKRLSNESELISWIESELSRGQLRIEAAALPLIMNTLNNWKKENNTSSKSKIYEWNSWISALRDAAEIRSQQLQMGQSLLKLLSDLGYPFPDDKKELGWPIAWAWACLNLSLPESEVIQSYLYSWVANQLSAALRLLPIGPNKIQVIQFKLLPLITLQSNILLNQDPHQLWSSDIGATMAQQSHTNLYTKLFRS